MTERSDPERLLLVNGMSGAGKSTALNTLEDLGWEVVDNLPLKLLDRLLDTPAAEGAARDHRPLAIGIDSRTRGFDADAVAKRVTRVRKRAHYDVAMLFLDCAGAELERRYDAAYPEAQAPFMWWIGDTYAANFGPARSSRLIPLHTYSKHGIRWSGGSDYPVTPVAARYGLWASVQRQTLKGTFGAHPFGMAESVDIHAALLSPGQRVSHTVRPGRAAWVQVARGSLDLDGQRLSAGDGAAIEAAGEIGLSDGEDAEVLLFDLAMRRGAERRTARITPPSRLAFPEAEPVARLSGIFP